MPKHKTILVTGGSGFIGARQCELLASKGFIVRCGVRGSGPSALSGASPDARPQNTLANIEYVSVGDLGPDTDWNKTLSNVDVVLHLAGRAHVPGRNSPGDISELQTINTLGTLQLARAASRSDVARFVFISTILVNGQISERPFREDDDPAPAEPYAQSKWDAEVALRELGGDRKFETVIVRAPLVYGPGVKGNFLRLLRWVDRGIPLPFAGVGNRRSLISLENLVNFLTTCVDHPKAVGQTFMVSDGEPVSTPELIAAIAERIGRNHSLFYFPDTALRTLANLFAVRDQFDKLCGSLEADSTKAKRLLSWTAPQSFEEAIEQTVRWYRTATQQQ